MPSIVATFPTTIANGQSEDATVVMSLFAFIQSQVNSNACPATSGSAILKGNGSGGTVAAASGTDYAAPGANSDITSLNALTAINGSPIGGLRNAIINGGFGVNQRAVTGTVTLAAGAYGHDRWKAGAGGCTYTYSVSNNQTVISISAGTLVQVIEGLNLQSQQYTLSWQGTAQARVNGGSYAGSSITVTATGGSNTNVEFSTGTVYQVQFEPGWKATTFELRPYSVELALAQRYYEVSHVSMAGVAAATGNQWGSGYNFKVTKRAVPTLATLTSNFATNVSATTTDSADINGFRYYATASASGFFASDGTISAACEI